MRTHGIGAGILYSDGAYDSPPAANGRQRGARVAANIRSTSLSRVPYTRSTTPTIRNGLPSPLIKRSLTLVSSKHIKQIIKLKILIYRNCR